MRVFASRRGFSLVELLTVIAIIAVLAGIIFPVMGMVKNRANQTKCMTQLHEIGMAVQVFKQENRKYPDVLGKVVQTNNGSAPADNGSNVIPFTTAGGRSMPGEPAGLFPEYVRTARAYHCPSSKNIDDKAYDQYPDTSGGYYMYSYNSYDYHKLSGGVQPHYTKAWAQTPADVNALLPLPNNTQELEQRDYERQLKFRTPPDDTVVTWCSWHASVSSGGIAGKCPTVFLDGHADALNAADVETQKWRVPPKRE